MTTGKRSIYKFFAMLTLLFFPFSVYALDVSPVVDGSIHNGTMLSTILIQVLNNPSLSDRGIIEFPLSSACTPVTGATLRLNVHGSNGPYPFNINVYTYSGNGSMEAGDFSAGTLATNFVFNGETSVDIDVTSSVLSLINSNSDYAGFNLRFEPASDITLNAPFVAFNTRENPPEGILILECDTNAIPTLSEWGMFLMILLIGTTSIFYIRRKQNYVS